MTAGRLAGGVLGLVVGLSLLAVGLVFGYAGSLAIDIHDSGLMVPPELEAIYRQVEHQTGVPWAALAAWDAAEFRFALPIPTVDAIFSDYVWDELNWRRRRDKDWCEKHPKDEKRCPPQEPWLTPTEQAWIWQRASASWRSRRRIHIERHARALQPYVDELLRTPARTFSRFLPDAQAIRAEELFEGYQILETLEAEADEVLIEAPQMPADWVPVGGFAWPALGTITSRYGMRFSPIDGRYRLHAGIDLGVSTGASVVASKDGQVVRAEFDRVYGWVVVIDHGGGYRSLYGHNSRLFVQTGQMVSQRQAVAVAGSTGFSTGPHLHFEIHYRGVPVNPLLVLTER